MPRISPVTPETAPDRSQELLAGVQTKLGITPNMMKTMGQSSATLDAYLKFSAALGGGVLPAKTREQIALAVGQANDCDYCLSAHTAIGKMVGLSEEQILNARRGHAAGDKADAILTLAQQIVEKRGLISDDDLEAARRAGVDNAEITEVVANTALNLLTNYLNHVAQTEIDFPEAEALPSDDALSAA